MTDAATGVTSRATAAVHAGPLGQGQACPRGAALTRRCPRSPVEPPDVDEGYEAAEGQDARSSSADGLLEELVGRDIATRLRARHAELLTRIRELSCDDQVRADWLARADALDPDTWVTPHDILDGVQHADQRFDEFRRRLTGR